MKILHFIHAALAAVGIAVTMTSCDEHIEFPDTAMKTCDILCTDGEIVRFSDIESKGKTPIGVVFHGVKQNTSANPAAFDGNGNTYAMYASGVSSAATSVFDMWKYGQSAYIPSVAQLQLLYASRNAVNNYISKCGGDVISDEPSECWYWSSTEVSGQESAKAWLFSLASGAMQETPKTEPHKIRPIITLYH